MAASRLLLNLLIRAFARQGPLVMGLDDTIEQRWGHKIAARGIYCDPEKRFDTQALLCTHPDAAVADIVRWFVHRWTLEVIFKETRAHRGVETQRQ